MTLFRVVLIPIFMIILLVPMNWGNVTLAGTTLPATDFVAALVFIFASCTDWVDGYFARKLNLITNFGKFVDPLADKLLVTAALVALVRMGFAPAWMVIVIMAREFAVSGLRQLAAVDGKVIAASHVAKWKTTAQMIAIIALLLHNMAFAAIDFPFDRLCLWLAVILTVISGWDYFIRNKHVILK